MNSPDRDPEPGADRAAILQWRRAERQRLLDARQALPAHTRQQHSAAIARHLSAWLGDVQGRTIAVYWPFRGEPVLHGWMAQVHAAGASCALPDVVQRQAPLRFLTWWPGATMARGVWDIPVPAAGIVVEPDIVVAPVVGFDPAGYRLGYGGGFYDRTLAARAALPASKPQVIGVGYGLAAIASIHPLPHDIPMDVVITEHGPQRPVTAASGF